MPKNLKRNFLLIAVMAFLLGYCDTACAQDRVRLRKGSETGEVVSTSRLDVTVSKGSTGNKKIPVNEIRSIIYKGEPNELTQARVNATNGGYQNALEQLANIDTAAIEREIIRKDIDFYKAFSAGKLALNGSGNVADAGRQLIAFLRGNSDNYHYLAAIELLGDLYVATGKYQNAERQYGELAKAPWRDYQARAAVLVGRALQAQGKHNDAISQFDTALARAGSGEEGKSQALAATLGKAISLAETGSVDQAVESIENVIRDADPEDAQLHALAYNALGSCYEKSKQPKAALLAYLHVDVLYSNVPEAHAKSLTRLAQLWQETGQEGRAREARQQLRDRYGRE